MGYGAAPSLKRDDFLDAPSPTFVGAWVNTEHLGGVKGVLPAQP